LVYVRDVNTMIESTRRLLLSLLFCLVSDLCIGFACFFVNWRVYLEQIGSTENVQSMAGSLIYAGIGSIISNVIFLVVWPQRPFQWIKTLAMFWSFLTGLLFSFGTYQYIMSAAMNIPASIAGPIGGLHVLVPPIWYTIFYRKCLGAKTVAGFILSSVSIVLFSGVLSDSISYNISARDGLTLLLIFLSWGFGMVIQAEAGKDCTFKQFPQVNTFMAVGYVTGYFSFACCVNASDFTKRSTWFPFGVDEILALLPTVSMNLGTGFFSACLLYTENVNAMVALTSLSITIPVILGIVVLKEAATWNALLGLVLAVLGIIILSFEVKEGTKQTVDERRKTLPSLPALQEGSYKFQQVSKTPLLSEFA